MAEQVPIRTPEQIERASQMLSRLAHMVRKQDHHWGYLDDDEKWPNDEAVLDDFETAQLALAALAKGRQDG